MSVHRPPRFRRRHHPLPSRLGTGSASVFGLLLTSSCCFGVSGCTLTEPRAETTTLELDFSRGDLGWQSGFSDYDPAIEEEMDLEAGHEPLPAELLGNGSGLYIAGTNLSDDLFMFWAGPVDGLEPFTRYDVYFEVDLATEAPAGCAGIGGAPGEAVTVKAAATIDEPMARVEEVDGQDFLQMNIDKGEQSSAGADTVVLGDIANDATDCEDPVWESKTLRAAEALSLRTLDDGAAWLLVGSDSGFEGRTRLFYTRYRARFEVP